jgi:hypothetical protein
MLYVGGAIVAAAGLAAVGTPLEREGAAAPTSFTTSQTRNRDKPYQDFAGTQTNFPGSCMHPTARGKCACTERLIENPDSSRS